MREKSFAEAVGPDPPDAGGSPEQIAGRLQRAYPDDMGKHLSAETIYVGLYVLPRGAL